MTRQEPSASARATDVKSTWSYEDEDDENIADDSRGGKREYLRGYRSVERLAKANYGGVAGRVGTDDGLVTVAREQVGRSSRQRGCDVFAYNQKACVARLVGVPA